VKHGGETCVVAGEREREREASRALAETLRVKEVECARQHYC
jgi:hypothetical protein